MVGEYRKPWCYRETSNGNWLDASSKPAGEFVCSYQYDGDAGINQTSGEWTTWTSTVTIGAYHWSACSTCTYMGVVNDTCNHCCGCHTSDDEIALNAMTTHEQSERGVCELFRGYLYYMESKRQALPLGQLEEWQLWDVLKIGFDGTHLDDRLNGGAGLCTHHVDAHRYRPAACWDWEYERDNWSACQSTPTAQMCLAVHSKAFLDSIPSTHAGLSTNSPTEESVRSFQLGQADTTKVAAGNFPDVGASDFNFYRRTKRWESGRRETEADCTMAMCAPNRMAHYPTKATCEQDANSYCEGHECKACDYDEYRWNHEGKKAAFLCSLVDTTDGSKSLSRKAISRS